MNKLLSRVDYLAGVYPAAVGADPVKRVWAVNIYRRTVVRYGLGIVVYCIIAFNYQIHLIIRMPVQIRHIESTRGFVFTDDIPIYILHLEIIQK